MCTRYVGSATETDFYFTSGINNWCTLDSGLFVFDGETPIASHSDLISNSDGNTANSVYDIIFVTLGSIIFGIICYVLYKLYIFNKNYYESLKIQTENEEPYQTTYGAIVV